MARYTGPRLRIVRRFGQQLPGLTRKGDSARQSPPGQHGQKRPRSSDYRLRLEEKQKLRFNYGLTERQLRNYFRTAAQRKGNTGENLLALLEARLDNVVFRIGFAPTIPAARQLVRHGHITVNGHRVDIPSYLCRPGDVVAPRERSRQHALIAETLENPSLTLPDYLDYDSEKLAATVKRVPERGDIPVQVQENFVVEFYSRVG